MSDREILGFDPDDVTDHLTWRDYLNLCYAVVTVLVLAGFSALAVLAFALGLWDMAQWLAATISS